VGAARARKAALATVPGIEHRPGQFRKKHGEARSGGPGEGPEELEIRMASMKGGFGGASVSALRAQLAEARRIEDPRSRATQLYFVARRLLSCHGGRTSELGALSAIVALHAAAQLGHSDAALAYARIMLRNLVALEASKTQEAREAHEERRELQLTVLSMLMQAAFGGLAPARRLLRKVLHRWPELRTAPLEKESIVLN
jgi:hypothetical protein